jgi:glycosyltransferase involved in cell wall biosynthesis
MNETNILITLDSMRYPNTGLYHFGKSLGHALIKADDPRFKLNFFLHHNTKEFDNEAVDKMYLKKYHKFFFVNYKKIKLFHFTDQMSRLKPKKVWGEKKILTIHDINQVHENVSAEKLNTYLKKLGERIYKCERIVAISQFAAKDILNYFPDIADRISVIHNGAEKLELKHGHQPKYLPQKKFLFAIGIISAKKNFHVLPALLVGNDHELIIAGIITPYVDQIKAEAKKHGVADRVKILGPVSDDDKAWYYKNCEAFVFPSIAEGFGLPVIEAMHFGKPVFVSARTSLPEIAGDAAYYFESFEPEAMQQVLSIGLRHFYEQDTSTKVMAHAAQYNWDTTAQQYLQLYHDVLAGN